MQKLWSPSWMESPWDQDEEWMLTTHVVAETDDEIQKGSRKLLSKLEPPHIHVNLHVTDWVATQWQNPVLKVMINWISNWKVQKLKHLLGDDANTKERVAVLWEQIKLMVYQGALYHYHTLAGKLEEILQLVVPMAHWVAAMNRCHWDAGYQSQQQIMYQLQDQFWWPGMKMQMHRVISKCEQCIQHKGTCAKAPMQPINVTTPLELLHIDLRSIEMTMKLYQPPNMVNVLVFCDHFIKHIMAYVPPDQTAKTIAKFLWQGYISIIGAPAKLLSDWGTNFENNVIKEPCELIGIQEIRTSP